MKLIKSFNLMENKNLIIWLSILSVPLTLVFMVLFTAIPLLLNRSVTTGFHPFSLLVALVAYFVLIIFHELIHGLFFKLFHPQGKVKYGFKHGLAYATSPHSFYSRTKFSWILLAPFILITLSLCFLYYINTLAAATFIVTASLHGASCIGDFYFVYLVLRSPSGSLVEDTEKGINFYRK